MEQLIFVVSSFLAFLCTKMLTIQFFSSDHADKFRFGVVRQFVGHGVGRVFHADPVILHFSKS